MEYIVFLEDGGNILIATPFFPSFSLPEGLCDLTDLIKGKGSHLRRYFRRK